MAQFQAVHKNYEPPLQEGPHTIQYNTIHTINTHTHTCVCVCVCVPWSLLCVVCGPSFIWGSLFWSTAWNCDHDTITHTQYIYIYIYILGAPQLQEPGTTGPQNSWLQNEEPGPIPCWGVIFLFASGPSKPLFQWLPICTSLEAKRPRCEADSSSAPLKLGSGNERTWEVRVKASRSLLHSGTFHTVPSASIGNKVGRRKKIA